MSPWGNTPCHWGRGSLPHSEAQLLEDGDARSRIPHPPLQGGPCSLHKTVLLHLSCSNQVSQARRLLKKQQFLSHSSGGWSLRSGCQRGGASGELPPSWWQSRFLTVSSYGREWVTELPGVPKRDWSHLGASPSWPGHLPRPHLLRASCWKVRISTNEYGVGRGGAGRGEGGGWGHTVQSVAETVTIHSSKTGQSSS